MRRWAISATLLCLAGGAAHGYPLDGAKRTGIRRLEGYRLVHEGKVRGIVRLPPGALLPESAVKLHLLENKSFDVTPQTPRDPQLQAGLEKIFAGRDPSYSVAIADITNPARPRYASLKADERRIPGSVGKLLVATGLFSALAERFPADTAKREALLRDTIVTADSFVYRDGKTVPFYNPGDSSVVNRRLEAGDKFSLWEYTDHMLSQSSNAAGSTVWKQIMLLRHFGERYPVAPSESEAWMKASPKPELSKLALESLEAPLVRMGLNPDRLRLGTFFTKNASNFIPGTASYGTPNELLRWLIRLEQGKVVDAWSSLELKKLLYFARPRYRYASAPELTKAAVFFKSGSLFECKAEPGYACAQYKGNETNLMHSVAIVESGSKVYLVAIMSNVLRINSAVEHQKIAGDVERLMQVSKSE